MQVPYIQSPRERLYAGTREESEYMDGNPSRPPLLVMTVPSKNRVNDKNGGALLLRILWWPAQEAAGRGDEATIAEWTQPGSGN